MNFAEVMKAATGKYGQKLPLKRGTVVGVDVIKAMYPRRKVVICPRCGQPGIAYRTSPQKGRELKRVIHTGYYNEHSESGYVDEKDVCKMEGQYDK